MDFELLQHVVVTIAAFGAAVVIVRRVVGVARTSTSEPKCSSCPSAGAQRPAQQTSTLTLIRPDRR